MNTILMLILSHKKAQKHKNESLLFLSFLCLFVAKNFLNLWLFRLRLS
jgi:hypothetical protein